MGYDNRLNSDDVVIRQQAEIEALRTALVASNSDSNGECDRLRTEIEALKASLAGQLRNTLAFQAERDRMRAHILDLLSQLDMLPVKHPQQTAEREAARAAVT